MYYLGFFGNSSSKIVTVQERMRALKEKENIKKNEEYKADLPELKKSKAIYIPSKYKLNLFIF